MPHRSSDVKRRLLGRTRLFSGLAAKELEALAGVARTLTLEPREQLFHKGDEGAQVYAVIEGRLKALTTSAKGDDVVFSVLGPGELFGEIALLGGQHRTATVTALDACTLLVIDRRDFVPFLTEHPEAAIQLLSVLAERVVHASELLEDTLFLNLPFRLAKKLCAFAREYGERSGRDLRIDLRLSQEEWGDMVGASRESVNKQIRAWTDEGILSVDHGYVVVHQLEKLERLAGCVVI